MTENTLLQALTREGVLINVSVRYWRACIKTRQQVGGCRLMAETRMALLSRHPA